MIHRARAGGGHPLIAHGRLAHRFIARGFVVRGLIAGGLLAWGLILAGPAGASDPSGATPVGLWRTIDDSSGQAKALVRIAERDGVLVGRIERLLVDVPDAVCEACPGELKGRPVVGLTILKGLRREGESWTGGDVLDPNNGKTYKAQLRLADGGQRLQLRGYVGTPALGRTQTWQRER
jgi:uncharacterized protein (DUF2147 family)